MSVRWLLPWVVAVAACAEPVTAIEVHVAARPGASEVAALEVTVENGGQMTARTFEVGDQSFPLTFTITPTGRTGSVATTLRALDAGGDLRGLGRGQVIIAADEVVTLDVTLEPADFVVNAEVDGDQVLAYGQGKSGHQVAAGGDRVAVVFVNDCPATDSCPVLVRVLDKDGLAVSGGDIAVNIDSAKGSVPAVAATDAGVLVTWQAEDQTIRAVALSPDGAVTSAAETVFGTAGQAATDPAVSALESGEYVVVWSEEAAGGRILKGQFVDAAGAAAGSAFAISDEVPALASPTVSGAGDGRTFAAGWIADSQVWVRYYNAEGNAAGAGIAVPGIAGATAQSVRSAMTPGGDMVVVFGATGGDAGAGKYALGRFSPPAAAPVHGLIDLGPATSAATPPAVAIATTGDMAAVWQGTDADGAGIWWQPLTADSGQVGQPQPVNTTVAGDQSGPAVAATPEGFAVAWTDDSQQAPDTSLRAVRGRALYRD